MPHAFFKTLYTVIPESFSPLNNTLVRKGVPYYQQGIGLPAAFPAYKCPRLALLAYVISGIELGAVYTSVVVCETSPVELAVPLSFTAHGPYPLEADAVPMTPKLYRQIQKHFKFSKADMDNYSREVLKPRTKGGVLSLPHVPHSPQHTELLKVHETGDITGEAVLCSAGLHTPKGLSEALSQTIAPRNTVFRFK